jgi:hypothetical protein
LIQALLAWHADERINETFKRHHADYSVALRQQSRLMHFHQWPAYLKHAARVFAESAGAETVLGGLTSTPTAKSVTAKKGQSSMLSFFCPNNGAAAT